MSAPIQGLSAGALVSELLAEAVKRAVGQTGILVRDVPYLAPVDVLSALGKLIDDGTDLRIAYLDVAAASAGQGAGIEDHKFSTRVEQAEVWRNDRALTAPIVVIAPADAAKLTSLEDFFPVGPSLLREFLVDRAAVAASEANDVLPLWWKIIGDDDQVSFSDLVDYYLILSPLTGTEYRNQAAMQINRLGLLPDPSFFDSPSEQQLRKRLSDNRLVALRLANFSEEDRQKVDKTLMAESDATKRADLKARLRDLQQFRRGGQLALTMAQAQQLLSIQSAAKRSTSLISNQGSSDTATVELPSSLTGLAIEYLLAPAGDATADASGDSLDKAVGELGAQIQDMAESSVRPEPVSISLPSGHKIDEVVATDVLNLMSRMVGEGQYGCLLNVTGHDITAMVRGFQQSGEVLKDWDRRGIDEYMNAFAEALPETAAIRGAFDRFDTARTAVLIHLPQLTVAPLLVAGAPATADLVHEVVASYRDLVGLVRDHYSALLAEFSDDAAAFVELLMLLDTVFLFNGKSYVVLLTPLHPLLLWHYTEYTAVIADRAEGMSEPDRDLIRSEFDSAGVPFFFASLGIPRVVGENAPQTLPFSGRFGGLPHFSAQSEARDLTDGLRPVRRLVDTYLALHPAAAEGFRIALLEPPDAGAFLSMCCDLAESGDIRGAHIMVLRRATEAGAELNLSGDEERRVQQRFGNHVDRRFTFETRAVSSTSVGLPEGMHAHLFVAFDQTDRLSANAGAVPQRIQPLANRRRLVYRIASKSLDLEPALGGILAEYSALASLATGSKIVSYQTIHQDQELVERFKSGVAQVPWYVIADGHVDRDLDLGQLRVLTDRDNTRDVVAVTRSPAAFRRSLRDVVRQFNTAVTDDKLDALLDELSDLLDAGLLSLRPGRSGDTVQSHVRGLLGLLVSVQALRAIAPAGNERVILSLDSGQARRWLHFAEDPHRADLLVIDGSDDGFTVTVVEVKTRQGSTGEYTVSGGTVSGPAISQMLATHHILRQVFDPQQQELLLTPSRREILRDHLYRELSKARFSGAARNRWAKRSENLFEGNAVALRCALIEVHLGVAASSLQPVRESQAVAGDMLVPVTIMDLNEDGVETLREALTAPPEELSAFVAPEEAPAAPTPVAPPTDTVRSGGSQSGPPSTEVERPRILLGQSTGAYGPARDIWFDPQRPEQALNNPHISISGETGSGKTQATKAILHDFMPQGLPALILDFKDDYSRSDYAGTAGFSVHDANFGSLPFNPMVPPIDPESGRANPMAHVHELANMLQRIYKLGDQQAFTLREAMKETYEITGVGTRPFVPGTDQAYLPFEAIRDVLVRDSANSLLGRLSPIFDLGLFSRGNETTGLDELLSTPSVIRLSQLPGDQVKNAVAEFFLMALYSFLIRREHPHKLERLLVLDEAWRLVNSPFLEPLMREGRAFGLGVVLATQFPKDLPDEISGSTATRLYFSQTQADQVREIQRTLSGKTSGPDAENIGSLVRGLAPLDCILQNLHYRPWVRFRVIPYYARIAMTGMGDESG